MELKEIKYTDINIWYLPIHTVCQTFMTLFSSSITYITFNMLIHTGAQRVHHHLYLFNQLNHLYLYSEWVEFTSGMGVVWIKSGCGQIGSCYFKPEIDMGRSEDVIYDFILFYCCWKTICRTISDFSSRLFFSEPDDDGPLSRVWTLTHLTRAHKKYIICAGYSFHPSIQIHVSVVRVFHSSRSQLVTHNLIKSWKEVVQN